MSSTSAPSRRTSAAPPPSSAVDDLAALEAAVVQGSGGTRSAAQELVASPVERSDASLAWAYAQMSGARGGVGGGEVTYAKFLKWWQAASKSAGDGGISDAVLNESRKAFDAADKRKTGTLSVRLYATPQPIPSAWASSNAARCRCAT
eukprot:COSAG05_NODE_2430_length_3070_cov_114.952035_2_plen_148_part_00